METEDKTQLLPPDTSLALQWGHSGGETAGGRGPLNLDPALQTPGLQGRAMGRQGPAPLGEGLKGGPEGLYLLPDWPAQKQAAHSSKGPGPWTHS